MNRRAFIAIVMRAMGYIPEDLVDRLIASSKVLTPDERTQIANELHDIQVTLQQALKDGLHTTDFILAGVVREKRLHEEQLDRATEVLPSLT